MRRIPHAVLAGLLTAMLSAGCATSQGTTAKPVDTNIAEFDTDTREAQATLAHFFDAWESKDSTAAAALILPERRYSRDDSWLEVDRIEFGEIVMRDELVAHYVESGGYGADFDIVATDVRIFNAPITFYYYDNNDHAVPHGDPLGWGWYLHRTERGDWLVAGWGY